MEKKGGEGILDAFPKKKERYWGAGKKKTKWEGEGGEPVEPEEREREGRTKAEKP